MSLDSIWKFVRYLLRRGVINSHEAMELMARVIAKRIKYNEPHEPVQGNLFEEEEIPF